MTDNFQIIEGLGATVRSIDKSSKYSQVVILDKSGSGAESLLTGNLSTTNSGTFAKQDDGVRIGSLTETAPASDTASSGLNGRLQRIAQRFTSFIALLPTALGANGGLKIEGVASGTNLPISGTVDTELPAAVALNSTILKSVSAPVVGKTLLVSDNTNFIQPLGDATNGLDVDITRISSLVAGTSYIGTVGKNSSEIDVVPTLSVAGTYASGDYVGTSATAMTFSGASRINNSTGTILSAVLIDYASQMQPCELWLFDTSPTPPTDNAAWSISDANSARCIGIISFMSYYSSALNSISFSPSLNIGFQTISASTSLYGCLVTRGTPTYSNGDLTVRLTINQD